MQKKNVTILTHTKDIFNQIRRRLNTGSSVNGSLYLDNSTSDSSSLFRQDSSSDQPSEHIIANGISTKIYSKQSHLWSLIINVCNSSIKHNKFNNLINKPSNCLRSFAEINIKMTSIWHDKHRFDVNSSGSCFFSLCELVVLKN